MSGHSKWKNIQHRKGAQDAVRGKMFTKVTKEIIVAVKAGGPDPDSNAKLRLALVKARSVNLPKDNIERAIKKGAGSNDEANYQEKIYEGYGPGGVALIVECLTDNLNRTVSEIRYIFSRAGGNLGTEGSVGYMFKKKGTIVYEKSNGSNLRADNRLYLFTNSYDITLIYTDPDSDLPDRIHQGFEMIRRESPYVADNLYHAPFYLYF